MTRVLPASAAVGAAAGAAGDHEPLTFISIIAAACGIWVLVVVLVQIIGVTQLYAGMIFYAVVETNFY
jgi:hypothetical protein